MRIRIRVILKSGDGMRLFRLASITVWHDWAGIGYDDFVHLEASSSSAHSISFAWVLPES